MSARLARRVVLSGLALALGLGLTGCGPDRFTYCSDSACFEGPAVKAVEPEQPYCMFDITGKRLGSPRHRTVAGPAGGWITLGGEPYKALTLVTADDYGNEVRPDAEPFNGILYNVPGDGVVAVDGHVCEPT